MKYRIGDLVLVRNDLRENAIYGNDVFIDTMKPFLGKFVRIRELANAGEKYLIEGSDDYWTDEMFMRSISSDSILKLEDFIKSSIVMK